MNIVAAVKLMTLGNPVSRASWDRNIKLYLTVDNGKFYLTGRHHGHEYKAQTSIHVDDILANDWESYSALRTSVEVVQKAWQEAAAEAHGHGTAGSMGEDEEVTEEVSGSLRGQLPSSRPGPT